MINIYTIWYFAITTYSISTLAVASSNIRILLFWRRALAKQNNCLWPTLKLLPPSLTVLSNPPSRYFTTFFSWTCLQVIILQGILLPAVKLSIFHHHHTVWMDQDYNVLMHQTELDPVYQRKRIGWCIMWIKFCQSVCIYTNLRYYRHFTPNVMKTKLIDFYSINYNATSWFS